MLAAILAFVLKLASGGVVDKVLGHLEAKANSDVEKLRIENLRQTTLAGYQRDVVVAGMGHRMFWVAWSIAAIPMAVWFAWGMADTIANGALPDVAEIPPGLLSWANAVWQNVFYTGAAAAGVTGAAQAIATAIARRK